MILQYISFLDAYCGKGLFICLYSPFNPIPSCGTLMIDSFKEETIHESIVGVILIVCGIFTIIIGNCAGPKEPKQQPYQA